MIDLVANKRDEIAALCRKYNIKRLDLFGSAATGAFDPATSDLDFVVDLGEYESGVARRSFIHLRMRWKHSLERASTWSQSHRDQQSILWRRCGQAEGTTLCSPRRPSGCLKLSAPARNFKPLR